MLVGDRIIAHAARRIGLVNHVLPAADVLPMAQDASDAACDHAGQPLLAYVFGKFTETGLHSKRVGCRVRDQPAPKKGVKKAYRPG